MIGVLGQRGVNARKRPGTLQNPAPQHRQPGLLLLLLGDRQLHRQGQRPGGHHVLRARADPPFLTAPARGWRQRQVAAKHQRSHSHRCPQLVPCQAHRVQPPAVEVHGNLPQGRDGVGVDGNVTGLVRAPGTARLPHVRHQRRHVLDDSGLIVRRHDRDQGNGGAAGIGCRRHRPGQRVELDSPRAVDLQQAQLRAQLGRGGARRVQDRRVLDRRDHQTPARHRSRPARDHQGIGLRTAGGQQHLVRIHAQSARQAGTRLRQQRSQPPAGGVLRAWIRPATEPTGQVLGDLPGDLGADRGGGGVIEIGAHTPSLDGGSEEPDCPLGTTLKPLFVCGAGP